MGSATEAAETASAEVWHDRDAGSYALVAYTGPSGAAARWSRTAVAAVEVSASDASAVFGLVRAFASLAGIEEAHGSLRGRRMDGVPGSAWGAVAGRFRRPSCTCVASTDWGPARPWTRARSNAGFLNLCNVASAMPEARPAPDAFTGMFLRAYCAGWTPPDPVESAHPVRIRPAV